MFFGLIKNKSKEEKYKIKVGKYYALIDNGKYAPKGSQPAFINTRVVFANYYNPFHPEVVGFIVTKDYKYGKKIQEKRVNINDFMNPQNKLIWKKY